MARFARDCIAEHISLSKSLELTLGPDTGDLRIRVGLHSGPITAGVLRGERSRFQLFGDTVNTAARLESSGEGNKIHISELTAKLIKEAGQGEWIKERDEFVHLKGKGTMKTYWLSTKAVDPCKQNADGGSKLDTPNLNLKTQRLVAWNAGKYCGLYHDMAYSIIAFPSNTRPFLASFLRYSCQASEASCCSQRQSAQDQEDCAKVGCWWHKSIG